MVTSTELTFTSQLNLPHREIASLAEDPEGRHQEPLAVPRDPFSGVARQHRVLVGPQDLPLEVVLLDLSVAETQINRLPLTLWAVERIPLQIPFCQQAACLRSVFQNLQLQLPLVPQLPGPPAVCAIHLDSTIRETKCSSLVFSQPPASGSGMTFPRLPAMHSLLTSCLYHRPFNTCNRWRIVRTSR